MSLSADLKRVCSSVVLHFERFLNTCSHKEDETKQLWDSLHEFKSQVNAWDQAVTLQNSLTDSGFEVPQQQATQNESEKAFGAFSYQTETNNGVNGLMKPLQIHKDDQRPSSLLSPGLNGSATDSLQMEAIEADGKVKEGTAAQLDSREGEEMAAPEPGTEGMVSAASTAPATAEGVVSAASTTPATTAQYRQLLGDMPPQQLISNMFSVMDTVQREEAQSLALILGLGPEAIRSHFQKMRSGVRLFLQKVQHKETRREALMGRGSRVGSNSGGKYRIGGYSSPASSSRVAASHDEGSDEGSEEGSGGMNSWKGLSLEDRERRRKGQLVALSSLLDPSGALVKQLKPAGPKSVILGAGGTAQTQPPPQGVDAGGLLLTQMQNTASWEVLSAMMHALLATPTYQLMRLVSSRLLDMLDQWLKDAESEGQVTFLKLVLRVVCHLPIPLPMLLTSPLQKSVLKLLKSKHASLSKAATFALKHFAAVADTQTGFSSVARVFNQNAVSTSGGTGPAGASGRFYRAEELAAGIPSSSQATQNTFQGQLKATQKPVFKPAKAAHFSTKPLTADDIRKAKEKQRLKALYMQQYQPNVGEADGVSSRQTDLTDCLQVPARSVNDASSSRDEPPKKKVAQESEHGRQKGDQASVPRSAALGADNSATDKNHRCDGEPEVPLEVIVSLRRKRELRVRAQEQAASVSQHPTIQEQVLKTLSARDEKTKALQSKRAEWLTFQAQVEEQARQYMYTMQPRCDWHSPPPWLPRQCLERVGRGEESSERASIAPQLIDQQERLKAIEEGYLNNVKELPEVMMSEAVLPETQQVLVVPWDSLDPNEHMQLNQKAWIAGVRLPGYVVEPGYLHQQLLSRNSAEHPQPALNFSSQPQKLQQQHATGRSIVEMGKGHVLLAADSGSKAMRASQPELSKAFPNPAQKLMELLSQPQRLAQMLKEQPQMLNSFLEPLSRSSDPSAQALLLQLQKYKQK
ncbi:hypothetical protein CEUSTIGMA_g970.t1 [Chlamydomonas eustigma]|uniref:Uncharacterized protein n=1 Tax=Chlamydomonas eustigma TaxID=1157962 RepID=A0A250WRR1_9CHLO|nr:hypothetical protein CEUSTIGMA_g970.t1 [Chlamydomonas eustigma]|eukprot:GAX73518.1 hypothetical protein CEUSTIGMA_g970.t1 [Chlamydomonas eustigma]